MSTIYVNDYVDYWFDRSYNNPREEMEARLLELIEEGESLGSITPKDLYDAWMTSDVAQEIMDDMVSDAFSDVEYEVEVRFDEIANEVLDAALESQED